MENYLFKNIRKIPTNLTCGDLIDLRQYLIDAVNCYDNISLQSKQAIGGQIFTKFEYKIFKAVNSYLETMDSHSDDITNKTESDKHLTDTTNNPWSSSPQIPTIIHNVNEFGHTPKRNSVHKTKHILTDAAKKDIKSLANLSRMFCDWAKNASLDRSPTNFCLEYYGVKMEVSFAVNDATVYLRFTGLNSVNKFYNKFYSFHCSPSVKHKSFSREFWHTYRRRMTKTIAKAIRAIDNNPNNWYYMEVKRGALD
jgi:hypothetical protein